MPLLQRDAFAHGQCYVALSRVRSRHDIRILVQPERIHNGVVHIRNFVYKELLSVRFPKPTAGLEC